MVMAENVNGFDLAHYLHQEFGVPRPPWSARIPPHPPFWSEVFGLLDEDQASGPSDNSRTDSGREWYASLSIDGPYPPMVRYLLSLGWR